ncbi:MAG TPA: DUF2272 domain-containing protein, partial [Hyphomicrobiales bacterium]|nr:DUF2272 domain-containing protein [Hyphomicrobiales bacterium]
MHRAWLQGTLGCCILALSAMVAAQQGTIAQSILEPNRLPRLDSSVLDVGDPAARVSGAPGSFAITERTCHNPLSDTQLRRRIVDIAVQEWAWFGLQVDDLRGLQPPAEGSTAPRRFRPLPLNPEEVQQVAATVSGYWSAIPNSDWILARQNDVWQQPGGLATRWRDPWSAAFISWVMCESGIGETTQFQRAIAHHSYIDQAIRASEGQAGGALFHAFEPGTAELAPGDMICSGLRPVYRSLAQRKAQLGEGARTHCDIVVGVDTETGWILTIGGNVRASVRMKLFPAAVGDGGHLAALPTNRYIFAHLQLTAPGIDADA